jgi:lipopolysaccharide export system permease protein
MRLLDRYVLITFVKNYLISFMVLVGLFITLDMVFNFDEFAEVQGRAADAGGGGASSLALLRNIVDFYAHQTFLIFAHLSGVIPVVAAAFTIVRLTRFNELTAVLAAGVPLLRVATPMIIVGVVLNLVLLPINQELIIPNMIPELTRKHDKIGQAPTSFPIRAMTDGQSALLVAGQYHPPDKQRGAWMEQVNVVTHDPEFQPVSLLTADRAEWDAAAGHWRLTNGHVVGGLLPHEVRTPPEPVDVYDSHITPDEIALYRSGDYINLLSTARINQLLERPQSYGTTDLLRVKHSRSTQWFLNVILLLLAMGCLLTRDPGRLKTGIMMTAVLVGLCMAAIFVSQQLAGTPQGDPTWADRWPAILAWAPILIFGPVAVWLLDRVRT